MGNIVSAVMPLARNRLAKFVEVCFLTPIIIFISIMLEYFSFCTLLSASNMFRVFGLTHGVVIAFNQRKGKERSVVRFYPQLDFHLE